MTAGVRELNLAQRGRLLAEVAERNFPVILELKDQSQWRRYKSRLLGVGGDNAAIWLETPTDAADGRPVRLALGHAFIVSFSYSRERYRFASTALSIGRFRLAGGASVSGVQTAWPTMLQIVQRRNAERYEIPHNTRVDVTMWDSGLAQGWPRSAVAEDKPDAAEPAPPAADARTRLLGRLVNISVGGLCVRLYGKGQEPPGPGQIIVVEFTFTAGPGVSADAVVRRWNTLPDGAVELGLQFVGMELTAEGRDTLATLSSVLAAQQRRNVRSAPAIASSAGRNRPG